MREEDVIKLAQSLISTPNVEDTAKQLVQFLEKKNIYLEEISYEDNPVIIAKAEGREKKNPLIFVTHLDVAPPGPEEFWSFPPFSGQIEGNVLKGRGAVKGKGGLASVAVALADLVSEGIKPERDVFLLALPDGERGYRSLEVISGFGKGSALIVAPTSTMSEWSVPLVCISQVGRANLRVKIRGRYAHPSLSWYGDNPLLKIPKIISILQEMWPTHKYYPTRPKEAAEDLLTAFLLGMPTLTPIGVRIKNEARIHTPVEVEIDVCVTLPPNYSAEKVANDLNSKLGLKDATIEILDEIPFFTGNPNAWIVKELEKIILDVTGYFPLYEWFPYPAAAHLMMKLGLATEVVTFGPGDFKLSYRTDEWVNVNDLMMASKVYRRLMEGRKHV